MDRWKRWRDALRAPGRLGAHLGVLAAAVLVIGLVQLLVGRGSAPALLLFGASEAVTALIAAASLAWTARTQRGWSRSSRLLLAAACGSWGAGQVVFAVQDVLDVIDAATTWADVPFVGFSLLSVSAVLLHLWGRGRSHLGVGAVLDGLLLGTALLTAVWVLWLSGAVAAAPYSSGDLAVPLLYPVVDVVFLTVTLVQLVRLGTSRVGLLCLAAATAMAVADAVYVFDVLGPDGFRTGGLADFGWLLAFGLFAVGAHEAPNGSTPPRAPSPGSWGWVVPCAVMTPATALAAVRLWERTDRFVLITLLAMVLLVVLRQVIALDDHRRLLAVAEQQRGQLDVLAHVDPLTGLENRRRFLERTGEAVRRSLGTGVPVVVAFVDLDRFKAVNDTLGHAAGDELLREVAARLLGCVREADCAARWGGDEFAVLVTDPGADAGAVTDRLRAALVAPVRLGGDLVRATASIGAVREDPRQLLADLPGAPVDPVPAIVEALLAAADARMYVVKHSRRDPVAADR